ncbi:uncharacterized protein METZ01_LOCUS459278 [marine metagenome]|uniref:Uncharacterized protein n=1 Tax=marine metagenome TaxID=408172 RepID=A0A383AFI1_9ZZZZ
MSVEWRETMNLFFKLHFDKTSITN